jgi:hypothetical protein
LRERKKKKKKKQKGKKKKVFKGFHLSIFEEDRRDHQDGSFFFSFLLSSFRFNCVEWMVN